MTILKFGREKSRVVGNLCRREENRLTVLIKTLNSYDSQISFCLILYLNIRLFFLNVYCFPLEIVMKKKTKK